MRRSEFPYAVEIAGHSRGQHAMRDFHARHGMRVHLKHVKHKDAVVTYAGALPVYPMEKFARQFAGVLRTAYL